MSNPQPPNSDEISPPLVSPQSSETYDVLNPIIKLDPCESYDDSSIPDIDTFLYHEESPPAKIPRLEPTENSIEQICVKQEVENFEVFIPEDTIQSPTKCSEETSTQTDLIPVKRRVVAKKSTSKQNRPIISAKKSTSKNNTIAVENSKNPTDQDLSSNSTPDLLENLFTNSNTLDQSRFYKCKICSAFLPSFRCIRDHFDKVHNTEYTCLCESTLTSISSYQDHLAASHPKIVNPELFIQQILSHIPLIIPIITFDCIFCTSKFQELSGLIAHFVKAHGQCFCRACGLLFSDEQLLEDHVLHHFVGKLMFFKCNLCEVQFWCEISMDLHVKDCHNTPLEYYPLTLDHHALDRTNDLSSFEGTSECPLCTYFVGKDDEFEKHIKNHTAKTCNHCRAKFVGHPDLFAKLCPHNFFDNDNIMVAEEMDEEEKCETEEEEEIISPTFETVFLEERPPESENLIQESEFFVKSEAQLVKSEPPDEICTTMNSELKNEREIVITSRTILVDKTTGSAKICVEPAEESSVDNLVLSCDQKYTTVDALQTYKCKFCAIYVDKYGLLSHFDDKHRGMIVIQCMCGEKFTLMSQFNIHVKIRHVGVCAAEVVCKFLLHNRFILN